MRRRQPVNFNLAYVGYTVLEHFFAYGVDAGLQDVVREFRAALQGGASARSVVPFNRKSEWGADGRMSPGAPVYSPFIRRKERLDLGSSHHNRVTRRKGASTFPQPPL